MQSHPVTMTVTGKRKQDYASVDFQSPPKLARHAHPEQNAPVVRTRPDALHALPPELLTMIVDRVIPESPYLARPYGENVGHLPIAPAMRALGSWATSCTAARALIAAVRKDHNRSAFRTLASSIKFELLGKTPLARAAAIEQYGIDPRGAATPHALLFEVQSPRGLTRCADMLQESAIGLERLELHLHREADLDLAILANALRQCAGLKVLSLHWNVPFPVPLLTAMHSMPALRTLALYGPALPADLFAELTELPVCAQLECLSVSAPDLSLAQLQRLAISAGRLAALRFLTLNGASLDADACAAIADACRNLTHLESLRIGALVGAVSAKGANALLQDLARNTRVRRLGLDQVAIDQSAGAALFDALRRFSKLNELCLSCPLPNAALEQITRMLSDPELHLQALDLECAELDEAGVVALADAVGASPWLHELRLARVKFTEASTAALVRAVIAGRSLLKLTLYECDIEPMVHGITLCNALSASATLRELHVQIAPDQNSSNDKTEMQADLFSYAAEKSSSLLHMTMLGVRDGEIYDALNYQAVLKLAKNRRRPDSKLNNLRSEIQGRADKPEECIFSDASHEEKVSETPAPSSTKDYD